MGEDPRDIRHEVERTRERLGDTADALAYKADVPARTKDAVNDRVGAVKHRLSHLTGRAQEMTPDGDQLKRGAKRGAGAAQENPLGLAIGAVAVGFVAGMLVPASRVEREKLGPVADQVALVGDEAASELRDTAQHAVEHGKQMVHEIADSAVETAKERGGEHAEAVRDDLRESAEKVGQQAPGT
jgi:gas vesicle protein